MKTQYIIFFYFLHFLNIWATDVEQSLSLVETAWIEQDFVKARKILVEALDSRNCVIYYNYALLLKDGLGGEKNLDEAIKYLKEAIEEKNDFYQAYEVLAQIYKILSNNEEFLKYQDLASKNGSALASYDLFKIYYHSYNQRSIFNHFFKAIEYLKSAQEQGSKAAAKESFRKLMNPILKDKNSPYNSVIYLPEYIHILKYFLDEELPEEAERGNNSLILINFPKIPNLFESMINDENTNVLFRILESYTELDKKYGFNYDKLKNHIDVINYFLSKGVKTDERFSKIIIESIENKTSVINIILFYQKEQITEIDPTLPINYTWIGVPTAYNRFAISGHDIVGPLEMIKTIHSQAKKNDELLYEQNNNYGEVNFYCIAKYVNHYDELFIKHLTEFNKEGYKAKINVIGIENYLNDFINSANLDTGNEQKAKEFASKIKSFIEPWHIKDYYGKLLLPDVHELKEHNKKITDSTKYYHAINNNTEKSRYFAVVKDIFTLFLLWNSNGYILDTNVIPDQKNEIQLAKFAKAATMIVPNNYSLCKDGNFSVFNDYYCIFSPEKFNADIEKWLSTRLNKIDRCFTLGLDAFSFGCFCGKDIGFYKINFCSHREILVRESNSGQRISVKSVFDLPEWIQNKYLLYINPKYEKEKKYFCENHLHNEDRKYYDSL